VRERCVDWHAASSGSALQPNKRKDAIAQVDEPFRLDAQFFEGISEFPNRLSNAFPPAIDGLAGPHVRRLDVLDIGSPQVQVRLLSHVERLVAAA
jgi:hypothetical protein